MPNKSRRCSSYRQAMRRHADRPLSGRNRCRSRDGSRRARLRSHWRFRARPVRRSPTIRTGRSPSWSASRRAAASTRWRAWWRRGSTEQFGYSDRDREPPRRGVQYRGPARSRTPRRTARHVLFTGNSSRSTRPSTRIPAMRSRSFAPVAFSARDSRRSRSTPAIRRARLANFWRAAKAKPTSFGFGGSSSRIVERICVQGAGKTAGDAVPYQSGAPALNALLGGHVDVVTGADRGDLAAGAAGQAACARGDRQQARARRCPTCRCLREAGLAGTRNQRLDRHPGARRRPG